MAEMARSWITSWGRSRITSLAAEGGEIATERHHDVGGANDIRRVCRDDDDAVARDVAQERTQHRDAFSIEVRVGLVERDDLRVLSKDTRQGDSLPLPTGERIDAYVERV